MIKYLVLTLLLPLSISAQTRLNVLETLRESLTKDQAYSSLERENILNAIATRFADYGLQVVDSKRAQAIPVVLHVITEGSFDEAPIETIANVAFAAYQAMSRGANPQVVEGIALYGYRKKILPETISAWANGYLQCIDARVPDSIASDLIHFSMLHDLSIADYNILKWAFISQSKSGNNLNDFATYVLGTLSEQNKMPGEVVNLANRVFLLARKNKSKVKLPEYKGSYIIDQTPTTQEIAKTKTTSGQKHDRENNLQQIPLKATSSSLWPTLLSTSRSYLGTPYVWGGLSHNGIDCSGLTYMTYLKNSINIPRVSRGQWKIGSAIEVEKLRNGDLVFFNTLGAGVSHVGMVTDANQKLFIQSSSSKGVIITNLDNKYFRTRYLGARRVLP